MSYQSDLNNVISEKYILIIKTQLEFKGFNIV